MLRRADRTGWEPALTRSRWTATLLLLLYLPGCLGWHAKNGVPPRLVVNRGPSQVHVRRTDDSHVTLAQPRIHADTLYGYRQARSGPQWDSIPLTEVGGLEMQNTDPAKTAFAVLGLGAVAAV
jgi:hypothetical protein